MSNSFQFLTGTPVRCWRGCGVSAGMLPSQRLHRGWVLDSRRCGGEHVRRPLSTYVRSERRSHPGPHYNSAGRERQHVPAAFARSDFELAALSSRFRPSSFPWSWEKLDADLFSLAIPALFSMLLDPVMGMVDTALLGRLGAPQLAAAGISNLFISVFIVLFNFLLFAATPLVAGAVARGHGEEASQVTVGGLWIGITAGVLCGALYWAFAPTLLARAGAQPAVVQHGISYLRYRALACPAILTLFVSFATFRGYKDTRAPLVASVLANSANFILDIVLMFGLGMGARGAALATTVSQYVSCAIMIRLMLRRNMLSLADLCRPPRISAIMPLLKAAVGLIPRGAMAMATYFGLNFLIAQQGPVSMAAHEVSKQGFILSSNFFGSLDVASQALVASHLGKGDRESARGVLKRAMMWAVGISCFATIGLLVSRQQLPYLFVKDAAVAAKATLLLPVIACFLPFDAAGSVLDGALLGARDTAWVSTASILGSALVAAALVAAQRSQGDVASLWFAFKIGALWRVVTSAVRLTMPQGPLGSSR